ncbi:MAG: pyruvate kinase [Elusimicrobia bacterium]|nr:pyruvate kinase [Elusimicrobiota bacterium]
MEHPRRTKIVATVGPAVAGPENLEKLIRAGADCLRFNFSHGTAGEHVLAMAQARAAARKVGRTVALLGDLCGPKIRTGGAPEKGVTLKAGAVIEVVPGTAESTADRISVSYPRLAREVRPGQRILLADGRMELRIQAVRGVRIMAKVVIGGVLKSRKGVNLPDSRLSVPAMTVKDLSDLKAMAHAKPDYVALSFVRTAHDLKVCRKAMDRVGLKDCRLIAKLEKPEALENLEPIVRACHGIMVARGDLGVEMPAEDVPTAQRRMTEAADRLDRICIVATEMLESMIENSRPTRAEVSDVACAVRDCADAVMLSAETSMGKHPFEAVATMARVLVAAEEEQARTGHLCEPACRQTEGGLTDVLALAASLVSERVGETVLAAATESGRTALYLSKSRPASLILGLSPVEATLRRMALYWGVLPVRIPRLSRHTDLLDDAGRCAKRFAGAKPGGHVVILSGTPLGRSGRTNTLHLRKI